MKASKENYAITGDLRPYFQQILVQRKLLHWLYTFFFLFSGDYNKTDLKHI